MFDEFRFQLWLRKAQSDKRRTLVNAEKRKLSVRSRNGPPDVVDAIENEARTKLVLLDDEIAERTTQRLIEDAQRLQLPTPARLIIGNVPINWIKSEITGKWHLNDAVAADLRNQIRSEQKLRWELRDH